MTKACKYQILPSKHLGFTLIELILVFSIIIILSTVGIASYLSYNRSQSLNAGASEVASLFQVARSRAQSQVKPNTGICVNGSLSGYKIKICNALSCDDVNNSQKYELIAICTNGDQNIAIKNLSGNVKFTDTETTTKSITFKVLTGGVDGSGNIRINNGSLKKILTISSDGRVTIN